MAVSAMVFLVIHKTGVIRNYLQSRNLIRLGIDIQNFSRCASRHLVLRLPTTHKLTLWPQITGHLPVVLQRTKPRASWYHGISPFWGCPKRSSALHNA